MDFRDPLFSIIMFFVIVLISVLLTMAYERIRQHLREKKLEEFLSDFEYIKIENLKLDEASADALYLLAKAYEKEGDFEKSLKIYLWISKNIKSTEILRHIANLYFKAGFLEKAKNTVYQILSAKPRDVESLKLLLLINEKLSDIKEIIDIIEIFEELEIYLKEEKAYALFKLITMKNCNIDFCENIKNLEDLYAKYPFILREYLTQLFLYSPEKAYDLIEKNNAVYRYLDLFWHRDDIPEKELFLNILAAQKKAVCRKKAPFEIEVLKCLPQNSADLEFEYICGNCKKVFPLYSTRCPNCYELFKQELVFSAVEKKEIRDIEF